MSIRMMFRKCRHCGHKYTYNPSIGDMGEFCPRCHKPQSDMPISLNKNSVKLINTKNTKKKL